MTLYCLKICLIIQFIFLVKERSGDEKSSIWPPPQARDYMRSTRELPSSVRVVGGETEQPREATHDGTARAATGENSLDVEGAMSPRSPRSPGGGAGGGGVSMGVNTGSTGGYSQTGGHASSAGTAGHATDGDTQRNAIIALYISLYFYIIFYYS